MGEIILLNDVSTDFDEAGLMTGDSDPPANALGQQQADIVSSYFNDKVAKVDLVFSSDATSLLKLVHKIRVNSKDRYLTSIENRRLTALGERNFGVLNGTPYPLSGELFSHTRLMPEKGESIQQCRIRAIQSISHMCETYSDKTLLLVSHPFICQIVMNAVLQREHTILTEFWNLKGSFVILKFNYEMLGIRWEFSRGYNSISDTSYTQDEIYSRLLGKEGPLPGQAS